MGGACNTHEQDEKCTQNLVGKREGKRPFGTHVRKWLHLVHEMKSYWAGLVCLSAWFNSKTAGRIWMKCTEFMLLECTLKWYWAHWVRHSPLGGEQPKRATAEGCPEGTWSGAPRCDMSEKDTTLGRNLHVGLDLLIRQSYHVGETHTIATAKRFWGGAPWDGAQPTLWGGDPFWVRLGYVR
jgi:hypothetical protein